MGWMTKVQFLAGERDFSLFHSIQTSSSAHPASRGFFPPGVKQLECEADDSPPSSAEVKNGGAIPPLPHTPSWHGA
jgi:hypothetical protein